jgi:PAS domain-containing protein
MPDIFAIYDAQRRFQFVSTAALEVLGKSPAQMLKRTDEEIFPPQVTQAYLGTLVRAIETGTIQTTEAEIPSVVGGILLVSTDTRRAGKN